VEGGPGLRSRGSPPAEEKSGVRAGAGAPLARRDREAPARLRLALQAGAGAPGPVPFLDKSGIRTKLISNLNRFTGRPGEWIGRRQAGGAGRRWPQGRLLTVWALDHDGNSLSSLYNVLFHTKHLS